MANIKTTSTGEFIYRSSGPNLNSERQIIFALFSIMLILLAVLSLAINS